MNNKYLVVISPDRCAKRCNMLHLHLTCGMRTSKSLSEEESVMKRAVTLSGSTLRCRRRCFFFTPAGILTTKGLLRRMSPTAGSLRSKPMHIHNMTYFMYATNTNVLGTQQKATRHGGRLGGARVSHAGDSGFEPMVESNQ